MRHNVLILGNSHTAAARVALRDDPERWLDFAPEVFAMPGNTLAELELRDSVLRPANKDVADKMKFYNGIVELPLHDHDAFVVVGGLSFAALSGVQDTCRSIDFPSVAAGEGCRLVSSALIDRLVRQRIYTSPALRMIRQLSRLGRGPVLFLDTVFPSRQCRTDPQHFAPHVAMAGRGDGAAWHARYIRLLSLELGDMAVHLPQPAHTVRDDVFTAPEWMRGSVRMNPRRDVPHEAAEYGHANAAYGALQIDQIVAAL